ncbi:hypothetical protein BGX24_009128 [Mortierella sp. AD032]|nr:hypothetical protein BGX24_009128 [Mortierella sp. AD032]
MLCFISDLLPTVYAEEKKYQKPTTAAKVEEQQSTPEEIEEARIVWTACEETSACAPLKHHLDECAKRVENGTFKEDLKITTQKTPSPPSDFQK